MPGWPWTGLRVRLILKNEAYAGVMVIGKTRYVLGEMRKRPREAWIRAPGAFAPVVSRRLFSAAQARFRVTHACASDDILLDELRRALRRHGRLSAKIIDSDRDSHCSSIYRSRFGSLLQAYQAIGYQLPRWHAAMCANAMTRAPPELRDRPTHLTDEAMLGGLRTLLAARGRLSRGLIADTPGLPNIITLKRRFGGLAKLYERLGYEPDANQRAHLKTI